MAVTGNIPTLIDLARSRQRVDRFVGRAEELASLCSAWPPVTLIFGEPGGGKTRLLGEAGRLARVSSVSVTCHQVASTVPLEPLLTVVRELEVALAQNWQRPSEAGRLSSILSTLNRRGSTGLVVQIDDAQWADDQTLDAITYLADRLRGASIRWHIAARLGEERCERLAVRLSQMRLGNVVRLREFGMTDFRSFVAATYDQPVDETVIAELYTLSGGNPLYAEQLIVAAADGNGNQPIGLNALLADRVRALTAIQLRVAHCLAIDAEPASLALLSELAGLHMASLEPVIFDLEAIFIAKVSPRGVQFRHDLLRRACYASMTSAERARLHDTMSRLVADPWRKIAHLDGAGRKEQAARELLAHGLAMLDRADRAEAQSALEEAAERDIDAPDVRIQAKAGLAALAALSSDIDSAIALMRDVETKSTGLPLRIRAEMRSRFAEAAFEGSDDTAVSSEYLGLAIEDAKRSLPETLPRLYALAGAVADRSGNTKAAAELLTCGIEACSSTTPARDRVRLKSWLGVVHGRLGDPELGTHEAEEAAAMAAANDLSAEYAHACIKCCYLADLRGDRAAYEMWCRRGLDHPGVKLPRVTAVLRLNLATAIQDRGELEEARALDIVAYAEARESSPSLRARVGCSLALANAMLGKFAEASHVVEELDHAHVSDRWRRAITFVSGRVFEMMGDFDSALKAYLAVAQGWVGRHEPEGTDVRAKAGEARILYQLGRFEELKAVWEFAKGGFERGWPLGASLRAEIEGYALIADGHVAEGSASLLDAAHTSKERFRAAYLKATAGLAKSDRDLINTAICELDEMGAQIASESIRRKAHGIGLRPRHRPRSKLAVTGSDVRIASLIRAGKTNAEIGTQLGLSTKTVEHYVSNMLAKLGLRSRAQLAATIGADSE